MKNSLITAAILCACFVLCLLIQNTMQAPALIPAIFVLGTFLTSVITEGYTYGIASALTSVIAVNYAFTFPFFKFNFTIPENLVSAIIIKAHGGDIQAENLKDGGMVFRFILDTEDTADE